MRIIVTGGAGFIGSAVCRHLIRETNAEVINVDKLTYAANLDSLLTVSRDPRYTFVKADICDESAISDLFGQVRPDAVRVLKVARDDAAASRITLVKQHFAVVAEAVG